MLTIFVVACDGDTLAVGFAKGVKILFIQIIIRNLILTVLPDMPSIAI